MSLQTRYCSGNRPFDLYKDLTGTYSCSVGIGIGTGIYIANAEDISATNAGFANATLGLYSMASAGDLGMVSSETIMKPAKTGSLSSSSSSSSSPSYT